MTVQTSDGFISPKTEGFIGTTALKDRGWTEAGIKRFLGDPDALGQPLYRSSMPPRLWLRDRVEACERGEMWQAWRNASVARVEAGKRAANTRRTQLLTTISELEIVVPSFRTLELDRLAVEHRNAWRSEHAERRGEWDDDPIDQDHADRQTLDRLCVNYLRHVYTDYDNELAGLYGKTGRDEATKLIRSRVLAAIGEAYPTLKAETERQAEAR